MPDFLGQLGTFLSGPSGKGLLAATQLGSTGAGLIGNILNERQRSAAINKERSFLNESPQQLAADATKAAGPLDRSLVQAVTNATNANLSEQGLSQAPGLIATATSQALAPFEQANLDRGMQILFQRLGLPLDLLRSLPNNTNLSQSLASLMQMFAKNPSNTFNIPAVTTPSPNVGTTGTYNFGDFTPYAPNYSTEGSYDFGSLIPPA